MKCEPWITLCQLWFTFIAGQKLRVTLPFTVAGEYGVGCCFLFPKTDDSVTETIHGSGELAQLIKPTKPHYEADDQNSIGDVKADEYKPYGPRDIGYTICERQDPDSTFGMHTRSV